MNCKKAKLLLSAYLDKELGDEEKSQALNHLNICPDCAKELGYLKKIKEILSYGTPAAENPAGLPFFETRLSARIREINSRAFSYADFTPVARKVALAGSFLMLFFTGIVLLNTYSTYSSNNNLTTEDYLLQSTSGSVEKKVFVESKISEDDVISLAMASDGGDRD
ncbi:MAG: hypothetical protein A2297_04710 [Elusimicrobia bacterium RIFOXYB2_FULL_48_7]|nr:MAG: hypothetical protein A2297_04710 [Elusimicrobia bacterium RIFOXYB2_FULL_48_7]